MPEVLWTPKAVADRLEEAAQTLRRLPPVKVRGYIASWPPIICDFWEAFGWHATEVRLGPPAPDAVDRMTRRFAGCSVLSPTRFDWSGSAPKAFAGRASPTASGWIARPRGGTGRAH